MQGRWSFSVLCLAWLLPAAGLAGTTYKDLEKNIPFEQISELRVKVEIGVANISFDRVQGNNLLEAKIHYRDRDGEPRIKFETSGKVGYLTIRSNESGDEQEKEVFSKRDLNKGEENWELRFTTKVPIAFNIELGLVDGEVNLSGMQIEDLNLSGGLSDLTLRFDEPNPLSLDEIKIECGLGEFKAEKMGNANFRRLRVDGGLGSIDLDLSGQWRVAEAELRIGVGLGSARVELPENLGVEVNADNNFLSSISLARDIRMVRSGIHRSENWSSAEHRLTIDAEVGLGSLKIRRSD
jgi:hypothetical protein